MGSLASCSSHHQLSLSFQQHVHDGRKESLDGFVKTFEKLPTTDGYPGIYALDCEMVGPEPKQSFLGMTEA